MCVYKNMKFALLIRGGKNTMWWIGCSFSRGSVNLPLTTSLTFMCRPVISSDWPPESTGEMFHHFPSLVFKEHRLIRLHFLTSTSSFPSSFPPKLSGRSISKRRPTLNHTACENSARLISTVLSLLSPVKWFLVSCHCLKGFSSMVPTKQGQRVCMCVWLCPQQIWKKLNYQSSIFEIPLSLIICLFNSQ